LPFGVEIPAGFAGRTTAWDTTDNVSAKFTGQERDTETGLDFFQARYHGSAQGRFLSPDPLGNFVANAADPQTWNMYAYARNNPLVFVDPTGLCSTDSNYNFYDDDPDGTTFQYDGPCQTFQFDDTVNQQNSGQVVTYDPSDDGDSLDPGFTFGAPGVPVTTGPTLTGPLSKQPGTCVVPSAFQRAGIAVQGFLARLTGKTIGVGLGASAAAGNSVGVAFSFSRQVVVSPNGQAAFATTVTSYDGSTPLNAAVSPGAGGYGGLQLSVSNAGAPGDVGGPFTDYGFGGGEGFGGGGDFAAGSNDAGNFIWQLTLTGGVGAGGTGHGLSNTNTSITPICGS
jgi:RHS repeat-associated protein